MRSIFDILILPMPLFSMTKFSKDLIIDNNNPFSRGIKMNGASQEASGYVLYKLQILNCYFQDWKAIKYLFPDIRSFYFQQEQSKGHRKAISSNQKEWLGVWGKVSSWTRKEISCCYFCHSVVTYHNKEFTDIYLSAWLLSHAQTPNTPNLSLTCIKRARTTESMGRHWLPMRRRTVLCRIATMHPSQETSRSAQVKEDMQTQCRLERGAKRRKRVVKKINFKSSRHDGYLAFSNYFKRNLLIRDTL